ATGSQGAVPPWFLMDASGNGATLSIGGTVNVVPSPTGGVGQAAQFGNLGILTGPIGTGNANGAITGSAFTAEFTYTPTTADLVNSSSMGRYGNGSWFFQFSTGTLLAYVYNSSNTGINVGSFGTLVAGTTYQIQL